MKSVIISLPFCKLLLSSVPFDLCSTKTALSTNITKMSSDHAWYKPPPSISFFLLGLQCCRQRENIGPGFQRQSPKIIFEAGRRVTGPLLRSTRIEMKQDHLTLSSSVSGKPKKTKNPKKNNPSVKDKRFHQREFFFICFYIVHQQSQVFLVGAY